MFRMNRNRAGACGQSRDRRLAGLRLVGVFGAVVLALAVFSAAASACIRPHKTIWTGTYTGPRQTGTFESLVVAEPEEGESGEIPFHGQSAFKGTFEDTFPEAFTGSYGGFERCEGEEVFHADLEGTVGAEKVVSEVSYQGLAVGPEASGTYLSSEGESGTWTASLYSTIESAGTVPGELEMVNPSESTAEELTTAPAPSGLPEGVVAPVGSVSYQVSGVEPGATVDVSFKLPTGSRPTGAYKYVSGGYVLYPADKTKIDGEVITLEITDNGPYDENPTPGIVSDPVVFVAPAPKAVCTGDTGTVSLKPGLTDTPAVQTMKIKGNLTGCSGEGFTEAGYTATLTTKTAVSCSILKEPGELSSGSAKFKWTPKAKPSTATFGLPLTETPNVDVSGALTEGTNSPLAFSSLASEKFTGGSTCGEAVEAKKAKAVKKGTIEGSTFDFVE